MNKHKIVAVLAIFITLLALMFLFANVFTSRKTNSNSALTSFSVQVIDTGINVYGDVRAGDIDGDGCDEILINMGGIFNLMWLDWNNNSWTKHTIGIETTCATIGDFDKDKYGEIAYVNASSGEVWIYDVLKQTYRRTSVKLSNFIGFYDVLIEASDLNDDGFSEIIFIQNNWIMVYDCLTDKIYNTTLQTFYPFSIGYIDNNAYKDIIFRSGEITVTPSPIMVYEFKSGKCWNTWFNSSYEVGSADIDGDGFSEIVYQDGSHNLVLIDNVDGKLVNQFSLSMISYFQDGCDFDGDGKQEFVCCSGTIKILKIIQE
jgi:hypothetical protein